MFNKILGRKEKSPDAPKESVNGSEGFLCPICYKSFESSDFLTKHFYNFHENNFDSSSTSSSVQTGVQSEVESPLALSQSSVSSLKTTTTPNKNDISLNEDKRSSFYLTPQLSTPGLNLVKLN
jgi:hypothetical protein